MKEFLQGTHLVVGRQMGGGGGGGGTTNPSMNFNTKACTNQDFKCASYLLTQCKQYLHAIPEN